MNYYRLTEIRPHDRYGATIVLSPNGLDSPKAIIIATETRQDAANDNTHSVIAHFGEERLKFTTYISDIRREFIICINTKIIVEIVQKFLTELEGPKEARITTQDPILREPWQTALNEPTTANKTR
jgi:hypothetical protein